MFLPVTMELLRGFWETVKIFFLTLAFSLPLGLVVAFGSMSRFRPLKRHRGSSGSFAARR